MKKQLLFFLATILSFNCYSQISFEKGYYIGDDNQKIEQVATISANNEFEYKLSGNSESKKVTIKSIKEFGVDNSSKYVRSTVNIDRSSESVNNLSDDKNPIFQEEEVFLKVLVDGKATLYEYVDGNLKRYFYIKENSNVEQLIYKKYRTPENYIGENNKFRQQLWIDLNCPNFKMSKIENVEYTRNDLVRFFIEYSECHNDEIINFQLQQKRDLFNMTIRPRINSSSLTIQSSTSDSRDTDFGNKVGVGFGLEAEFVLPFNKNKWAIAIEPTYQSFKSEKRSNVNNVSGGVLIANVDYSSIEFPVGLRHYLFLSNNSKVFINASYIFDLSSKSSIEFTRNDGSNLDSIEIETRSNLAIGIGYKQNDRYSLEVRYQTNREILRNYLFWNSEYKTLSIVFGYSLF